MKARSRWLAVAFAAVALVVAVTLGLANSGTGLSPFARSVGEICTDIHTNYTRAAIRAGFAPSGQAENLGVVKQQLELFSRAIAPEVPKLQALHPANADEAATRDRIITDLKAAENLSADIASGATPSSGTSELFAIGRSLDSAAKKLGLSDCGGQALT